MGYSRGENKEFEALFRSMYPKVKAFAQGILQSEDDAEDIAQDVFVKLLNYPQAWENPETRNSYIYTLTKHQIFNLLKHRKIEDRYQESFQTQAEEYFTDGDEIHNHLFAKELRLLAELTIQRMPEQRRKVFMMSRIEKKTHAEIAAELNLSVRTVERHVYLALAELKKNISIFLLFWVE